MDKKSQDALTESIALKKEEQVVPANAMDEKEYSALKKESRESFPVIIPSSPDEAEDMGAFEETAMSWEDALESIYDEVEYDEDGNAHGKEA